MSAQFRYRFPSEAAASEEFGLLVRQLQAEVPVMGWHLPLYVTEIATGYTLALRFVSAPDGYRELTQERAMRRAWKLLLDAGVEPPGMKLGNLIGAIEVQALLYVLTHGLVPPELTAAAKAVLRAAGVDAPDSVAGVLLGAAKGNPMAILKALLAWIPKFLPGVIAAIAEGKLGPQVKAVYWWLAGKKTIFGVVLGAVYGLLVYLCSAVTAGSLVLPFDACVVGAWILDASIALVAVGLLDAAVRAEPPMK